MNELLNDALGVLAHDALRAVAIAARAVGETHELLPDLLAPIAVLTIAVACLRAPEMADER